MAVIKALRTVPTALARNPILVVIFGLFGLVQAPQLLAQQVSPLASLAISGVLILVYAFGVPFVQAGTIGMVDEALRGQTTLGTFLNAGKRYYVSLLGAYLLVLGVNFVFALVVGVAVFAGVISVGVGGSGGGLLVAGGIALVVGLVYLVFAFFIQFYGQEIVLNNAGAIASLKQSAGLVRANFLSSLAYLVVAIVAVGILGVVFGAASTLLLPAPSTTTMGATPSLSAASLIGYVVVSTVGTALFGSVMAVFSVAFYRELRGQPARADSMASA